MPKERESELHHLEGKTLQMHSSCVKKNPAARHKEFSEFDALSDLKKLSDKSDQLAEKKLANDSGFNGWLADIRKILENFRDSKNTNIEHPPSIEKYIHVKEERLSPAAETTPVLNMTVSDSKKVTPNNKVITLSNSEMIMPILKVGTPDNKPVTSDSQMVTPATSLRKKVNPFVLMHQLSAQEINAYSNDKNVQKNNKTVHATPILNRTFDKINTTVILDSASATKNSQTSNAISSNDNGTRSNSKKKKENECPNSHGMLTRSGSKRKSSDNKNKSSKKQKIDFHNISSATLNKTAKSRHPLRDLKSSVLAAENKNKLSAVIKQPVLQKLPLVSKEQQMLEEIMKKEKKREENVQRAKAERKQKVEQDKKTREEKRTRTQLKRLQLEKEKEEKREMEAKKSQVRANKENPKKTTRAKELVEQHIKESKSSIITSTTQSVNNSDAIVKTPPNRRSDEIESYDLTPVPDSSTYNFSDDEEEDKSVKKRIPLWAQGVLLKSALMHQHYNPVDTDLLFGNIIETPNLVEIFKINKKRYLKRTSSAVWNSPPDRSHYL